MQKFYGNIYWVYLHMDFHIIMIICYWKEHYWTDKLTRVMCHIIRKGNHNFWMGDFQKHSGDWYVEYFHWRCSQVIAAGPQILIRCFFGFVLFPFGLKQKFYVLLCSGNRTLLKLPRNLAWLRGFFKPYSDTHTPCTQKDHYLTDWAINRKLKIKWHLRWRKPEQ